MLRLLVLLLLSPWQSNGCTLDTNPLNCYSLVARDWLPDFTGNFDACCAECTGRDWCRYFTVITDVQLCVLADAKNGENYVRSDCTSGQVAPRPATTTTSTTTTTTKKASVRPNSFKYQIAKRASKLTGAVLDTMNTKYELVCGQKCYKNLHCNSFGFNTGNGMCSLYAEPFDEADAVAGDENIWRKK